jgi:hypothetical protein
MMLFHTIHMLRFTETVTLRMLMGRQPYHFPIWVPTRQKVTTNPFFPLQISLNSSFMSNWCSSPTISCQSKSPRDKRWLPIHFSPCKYLSIVRLCPTAKAVSTVCTCVLQLLILLLAGCQCCRGWWLGCQLTWWYCAPKAESPSRPNGESHDLMLLFILKSLDPRLPLVALSELVFSLDRALLSTMVVPWVCFLVILW